MDSSDRSRDPVAAAGAASLPAATHIGMVSLQVSRLDRSIDYYTTTLGFEVLERTRSHARMGAAEEAPLLELHERTGAASAHPRLLGLYHFAILLPDRRALGRLIRHLGERRVQLGSADHLVSEAIYLYDPDGLGIEVYADRPRSRWRMQAGELAMATDPLDIEGLLQAGGAEPWKGMPAGTTIGHVHLSVGELQRARAFYHEQLGLDVMVTRYPGALFLSAGGYHHHLGLNTWAGPRAAPAPAEAARLLYWELVAGEAAAASQAAGRLEHAGNAVTVALAGEQWTVQDPWGIELHLRAVSAT